MNERKGQEKLRYDGRSLDERLKGMPELREQFDRILRIAEASEDIDRADDAELRIREEAKALSLETLQKWA